MKIACLITGHVRTYDKCFPSFKQHVIDRWNPDIYMLVPKSRGYLNMPNTIRHDGDWCDQEIDVLEIENLYKPKKIKVDAFTSTETSHIHHWSMWSAINRGADMIDGEYDAVIRTRPDCIWKDSPPIDDIGKYDFIADKMRAGDPHSWLRDTWYAVRDAHSLGRAAFECIKRWERLGIETRHHGTEHELSNYVESVGWKYKTYPRRTWVLRRYAGAVE